MKSAVGRSRGQDPISPAEVSLGEELVSDLFPFGQSQKKKGGRGVGTQYLIRVPGEDSVRDFLGLTE